MRSNVVRLCADTPVVFQQPRGAFKIVWRIAGVGVERGDERGANPGEAGSKRMDLARLSLVEEHIGKPKPLAFCLCNCATSISRPVVDQNQLRTLVLCCDAAERFSDELLLIEEGDDHRPLGLPPRAL